MKIRLFLTLLLYFATTSKAFALGSSSGIEPYILGTFQQPRIGATYTVSPTDIGKEIRVFTIISGAGFMYVQVGPDLYRQYEGGPLPYASYTFRSKNGEIDALNTIPMLNLPFMEIYSGYGYSFEDMIENQRLKLIYPPPYNGDLEKLDLNPSELSALNDLMDALKQNIVTDSLGTIPSNPTLKQLSAAYILDRLAVAKINTAKADLTAVENAQSSGEFNFNGYDSLRLDIKAHAALPSACSSLFYCTRHSNPKDSSKQVLYIEKLPAKPALPNPPPPVIPVADIPLVGLPEKRDPKSFRILSCMDWAIACKSINLPTDFSLGDGWENLALVVKAEIPGIIDECKNKIHSARYASILQFSDYFYGSGASIIGNYNWFSNQYTISCEDSGYFPDLAGKIYTGNIDMERYVFTPSPEVISATLVMTLAKHKEAIKLAINQGVDLIPVANIANGLVKCSTGISLTDIAVEVILKPRTQLGDCVGLAKNVVTQFFPPLRFISSSLKRKIKYRTATTLYADLTYDILKIAEAYNNAR